jgi:hypothetical protein
MPRKLVRTLRAEEKSFLLIVYPSNVIDFVA